jgi:hypothetical protein
VTEPTKADDGFPAARSVSPDLLRGRGERRRAGVQWPPLVWAAMALVVGLAALVLAMVLLGPR